MKNVRTPDQEESLRSNAKRKSDEYRSNAPAYSSQNARVELKSSKATAHSSQNARLKSLVFA